MKKILVGFLIVVALVITAIYILIPPQIQISRTVTVNCSRNSANQMLGNYSKWMQWWPGTKEDGFSLNNIHYTPQIPAINSYHIGAYYKNDSINSTLFVLLTKKDSVSLMWSTIINTSNNPLDRFSKYRAAKDYIRNMDTILQKLKYFLEQTQNLYGIRIDHARVKDTLLVSSKIIIDHSPSTEDIYRLVGKLKAAIAAGGAETTNFPMLNVSTEDSIHFSVQVAIPVNKAIIEENDIVIKKMVPGNILVTEDIIGGNYSINKAFQQVNTYVTDFRRIVPAIPFQSLITDRQQQPDTSKWITKIYCPIY